MNAILGSILRFFRRPLTANPAAGDPTSGNDAAARPAPGGLTRQVLANEYRITLDLSAQVLGLELPTVVRWDGPSGPAELSISPVLPQQATGAPPFVSAAVLAQKAKIFDDGLYAAVELMAQRGAGRYAGKVGLLRALSSRLSGLAVSDSEQENVPSVVCGAAMLGEVPVGPFAPDFQASMQRLVTSFLTAELQSKPIGFYTWSPELSALFRQDRMLQQKLSGDTGIAAVARALHENPELRAAYEGYLRLVAKLTNPPSPDRPDLRSLLTQLDKGEMGAPSDGLWFFPPSRAHETDLGKALYGNREIPPDFDLLTEMIHRIRQGDLKLAPSQDSGWYDYQAWALEPLVIPERMPEGNKILLGPEYRKLLPELFKGILSLARETHIKQLEIPVLGGRAFNGRSEKKIVPIEPALSAEPLPSFYLRRAMSYRFLRMALDEIFGEDALRSSSRLTPGGPVGADLHGELCAMEALFYGAHAVASCELGLQPDKSQPLGGGEGPEAAARSFQSFAGAMGRDADLAQDVRMMVPVFYDSERRKTKVWAFLGWAERPVEIRFKSSPAATVVDMKGRDAASKVLLQFNSTERRLSYPVTAEVYVEKLLDRDQFRRHCDQHKTRSAILANLH